MDDSIRLSRQFGKRPREFVSDELRGGWRWNEPPLLSDSPPTRLSVSDVASGICPTGRDVFNKSVSHVRPGDNPSMHLGLLVHITYETAVRTAKKLIYSGINKSSDFIDAMRNEGERNIALTRRLRRWSIAEDDFQSIYWSLWDQATSTYSGALGKARTLSKYATLESLAGAVIPINVEFMIDGSLIGLTKAIRIDGVLLPFIPIELKTGPPRASA